MDVQETAKNNNLYFKMLIIAVVIITILTISFIIFYSWHTLKKKKNNSYPPIPPISNPNEPPSGVPPSSPPMSPTSGYTGLWYYYDAPGFSNFSDAQNFCTSNNSLIATSSGLDSAYNSGWNNYCNYGWVLNDNDNSQQIGYISTGSPTCSKILNTLSDNAGFNQYTVGPICPPNNYGVYCYGQIPMDLYNSQTKECTTGASLQCKQNNEVYCFT